MVTATAYLKTPCREQINPKNTSPRSFGKVEGETARAVCLLEQALTGHSQKAFLAYGFAPENGWVKAEGRC